MAARVEPIRYRDTGLVGLVAVPAVHGEAAFADVLEGVRAERFDVIGVELGADTHPSFVEGVAKLGWTCGVAVQAGGDRAIPIVPTDSIASAARQYVDRRGAGERVDFACLDLPIERMGKRSGAGTLLETWTLTAIGIEGYIDLHREQLESCRIEEDARREEFAAAVLARYLEQGKRILYTGGLAHWARIVALLESGSLPAPERLWDGRADTSYEFFAIDGSLAWFLRWMQNMPAVAADFVRHVDRKTVGRFDIPAAVDGIIDRALVDFRAQDHAMSARAYLTWTRFLRASLSLSGRRVPRLEGDLCRTAEAVTGGAGRSSAWAGQLKETGLRYPWDPKPDARRRARLIIVDGEPCLRAGRRVVPLGADAAGQDADPRTLPIERRASGRGQNAPTGPYLRTFEAEDALHKAMSQHAAAIADGVETCPGGRPTYVPRLYEGDLMSGIHQKMSIYAWTVLGEDTFYVRAKSRRGAHGVGNDDGVRSPAGLGMCPIAWIFQDGQTAIQCRDVGYLNNTVSSVYYLRERVRVSRSIVMESVAYCVNVLRSRTNYDRESVERLERETPDSERPSQPPWLDEELRGFVGPEQAVAMAVKYASKGRAIVVAPNTFRIGHDLDAFTRRRGVRLHRIPWSAFGEGPRRRLSMQHVTPAADRYAPLPESLTRQIPVVEPFRPPTM